MDIFKEVKSRVKIVDVCNLLGIKLNRNYKCLCPFHREKTPSFSVHPEKNIFSCFIVSHFFGRNFYTYSRLCRNTL